MKNYIILFNFLFLLTITPSVNSAQKKPIPVRALTPITHTQQDIKLFQETIDTLNPEINEKNPVLQNLLEKGININDCATNKQRKKLEKYFNQRLLESVKQNNPQDVAKYLNWNADPNYTLEIEKEDDSSYKPLYDFISPLKESLNLKTTNSTEEAHRRAIIVQLLEFGANPLLITNLTEPTRPLHHLNLFVLDNVLDNPELAQFVAQNAKLYAKATDKINFLQKFNRSMGSYIRTPFYAGSFFIALDNIQDLPAFWTKELFDLIKLNLAKDKENVAKFAQFLIFMGAQLDYKDPINGNIFFQLTSNGNNTKLLKTILESEYFQKNSAKKIELLNEIKNDKTPLSNACFLPRNIKMVELLLKHGAKPNAPIKDSIILQAVLYRPKLFSLLLEYGAHPGAVLSTLIHENKRYSIDFIKNLLNNYTFDKNDLDKALEKATHIKGTKDLTDENFTALTDALLDHGANPHTISVQNDAETYIPNWQKIKDFLIQRQRQIEALKTFNTLQKNKVDNRMPLALQNKIVQMTLEHQ